MQWHCRRASVCKRRKHVWSYDFVEVQTHDGRKVRQMTLIDKFTRKCLTIRVARRLNGLGVLETMADVILVRGVPEHIRSDNGLEMIAKIVRSWLAGVGANPRPRPLQWRLDFKLQCPNWTIGHSSLWSSSIIGSGSTGNW
jgi:transposase InsO family protein